MELYSPSEGKSELIFAQALNLPKWAVHHAAFLNPRMDFRHWIVWDATGDPKGALIPSHYALLHYTKPGGKPAFNYTPLGCTPKEGFVQPPDAANYCLRENCRLLRKARGDDDKAELADVWYDIHRLTHRKHRDSHPCQLPDTLMERIVLMTTQRGGFVFDPFGGAGTTAIAATKLGRNFVVVEQSKKYVRITERKLAAMRKNFRRFGVWEVPRKKTKKKRRPYSQAAIHRSLKQLTRKLGRLPTETDIDAADPTLLKKIDAAFSSRKAALKRCKQALPGA